MSFPFHVLPHLFHALSKAVEDLQRDFDQRREEKAAREWQARRAAELQGSAGLSPQLREQLEQFHQKPEEPVVPAHDPTERKHDVGAQQDVPTRTAVAERLQKFRVSLMRRQGEAAVDACCPCCGAGKEVLRDRYRQIGEELGA